MPLSTAVNPQVPAMHSRYARACQGRADLRLLWRLSVPSKRCWESSLLVVASAVVQAGQHAAAAGGPCVRAMLSSR